VALAVALAGDGSVVLCPFSAHGRQEELAASLQARLDDALRGRRCERMLCLRDRVLLLLEGGEAAVLGVDQELPPTLLTEGEVEDVLEAVFGVLLRFADGRRVWLEAERTGPFLLLKTALCPLFFGLHCRQMGVLRSSVIAHEFTSLDGA